MSATSGDPGGPDDVDARFRSIIDAEFGPEAPTAHAPAPAPRASSEPFNLARALDEVTPDEVADPFEPPAGEPMPALRGRVLVGVVMLVTSLTIVLLALFGVALPRYVGPAAVACFGGGLAILLVSLPKGPRDPWDDGTRV